MRLMTKLVLAAVVLGATACSDSSGPNTTVAGTYTLRTINGANLPFELFNEPGIGKLEVMSDVLTLTEAKTFTEVFTSRETVGTTVTTETTNTTGTYTETNGLVRLTDTEGEVLTGSFTSGNTLTISIEGAFTLVFRK